ncbi:MAG: chromosomal replication initiator protein DnaA [Phycisphaerales bacterium]|nr:chromosomal replication initiator protein DnaA [Phycisphaerales bacterium]
MPTQIEGIEDRIRARIAELVGPQRYKVWFKNSTQFAYSDGFLKVGVPNLFIGGWIEDHFADVIAQAASDVLQQDQPFSIKYAIDPVLFRNMRKSQLNSQAAFIEKNAERAIREVRGRNGKNGSAAPKRKLRGRLDDFVVGAANRLAYSVAQSVVENVDAEPSPVFFHSACGLGKTHLLHGIANALSVQKPKTRWIYVSGEEFTNQFLYALRERRLDGFRHRYRDVDVLLLDDMQFIANKKATQEEFLHTFNTVNGNGKHVILASDAHPKMIGDLSESLVNRLVAGMIVRIERPDKEIRCEILRRQAAKTQHKVPEPVIDYIADKIHANVRELEGCLLKLLAYASLTKAEITLDLARQALEDHLTQTGKILTVSDIEQSVATFFGLTPADLHTSRKSRTIALARNIAMYLARKHTDLSFPEIARLMGNKNHTTVLLACRRIGKYLEEDAEVTWQNIAGPQSRKIQSLIESQEEQLRVGATAASSATT